MFEGMVGSKVGLEMLVGIQEARKAGAEVVYGDQDVNVTMSLLKTALLADLKDGHYQQVLKDWFVKALDPRSQQKQPRFDTLAEGLEHMKSRQHVRENINFGPATVSAISTRPQLTQS